MSDTDTYIFDPHANEAERERLQLLERAHDPQTIAVLSPLVTTGMTCLEVGPGAGSIARWLAEQVDTGGKPGEKQGAVIALDSNARFLREEDGDSAVARNMRVIEADVTTQNLPPETFDLAHARFVFLHVEAIEKGLHNMVRSLKPGGSIVLEEPDFTLSKLAEGSAEDAQTADRVHHAVIALYTQRKSRPYLGSLLPVILKRLELENIAVQTHTPLESGSGPVAQVMQRSVAFLGKALAETGVASPEDIERYLKLVADPDVWFWHYATVSASGRRPKK